VGLRLLRTPPPPTDDQGHATLHAVTQECRAHAGAGPEEFPFPLRVAARSTVTIEGVPPFRVGNTTSDTVDRLVDRLRSPSRTHPIVLLPCPQARLRADRLLARGRRRGPGGDDRRRRLLAPLSGTRRRHELLRRNSVNVQ
jgi:hypothetical protein